MIRIICKCKECGKELEAGVPVNGLSCGDCVIEVEGCEDCSEKNVAQSLIAEDQLAASEQEVFDLEKLVRELEEEVQGLQRLLAEKEQRIANLEAKIELELGAGEV